MITLDIYIGNEMSKMRIGMVNSLGIINSLFAIKCIAFSTVAPCNVVDYKSVVGEYFTSAACNSEMYLIYVPFRLGIK